MAFPRFHGIRLTPDSHVKNFVVESLSADPSVTEEGHLWFNDTEKTYKISTRDIDNNLVLRKLLSTTTVQNYFDGIQGKHSVRATTMASMGVWDANAFPDTIDDVSLIVGDRILVKNDGVHNGIYVVQSDNGDGTVVIARSSDADNSPEGEVVSGIYTLVEEGTANAGTGWMLSTANPITLGTTPLTFEQFTGVGDFSAGAGISKAGVVMSVALDGSTLTITENGLKVTDGYLTNNVLDLEDTPSTYGTVGQTLAVNGTENGFVWANVAENLYQMTDVSVTTQAGWLDRTSDFYWSSTLGAWTGSAWTADGTSGSVSLTVTGGWTAGLKISKLKITHTKDDAGNTEVSTFCLTTDSQVMNADTSVENGEVVTLNTSLGTLNKINWNATSEFSSATITKIEVFVEARYGTAGHVLTVNEAETGLEFKDITTSVGNVINTLETNLGINADGTYPVPSGTNYLDGTSSILDALTVLDTKEHDLLQAYNSNVFTFQSTSADTTHVINHGLTTQNVFVTVWVEDSQGDGKYHKDIPEIIISDDDNITINLGTSENVRVIVRSAEAVTV